MIALLHHGSIAEHFLVAGGAFVVALVLAIAVCL
jgi:hypothetical protein